MHKDIAKENFARWNDDLKTLCPDAFAEIYTEDATFLPTLSPDFKRGIPGEREYFVEFLKKHPVGTVIEEEVRTLGENAYLHTGFYDFEVDGSHHDRTIAHARFTYLWVLERDGVWRIVHHHSSLVPSPGQQDTGPAKD